MPDLHSLADSLYYTNRREYSERNGNVMYLDGAPLRRPLSLPAAQRVIALVIVIAALILGGLFINNTVLASYREAAALEQAITENLSRQASIETIPNMADLVQLSDEEIVEKFSGDGYTIFDASKLTNSDDLTVYRLPSDVSAEEAASMFAQGINGLSVAQATKLLNGSWYFGTERSGATSMVTRYADFSTADPQVAVSNAIAKEGYDPDTISESGVDEHGNTFSTGVVEIDDKDYVWKVSALPLSEMYSISGMPEGACYVGVRITAQ